MAALGADFVLERAGESRRPEGSLMRVLMTADAVGGVWRYVLELARGLEGEGAHFALAIMGGELKPDEREEAAALANVVLFERPFRLEWMAAAAADLAASSSWLLDIAARFRPHLIHVNGYYHAALPWERPVLVAAHSCVFSWWNAVWGETAPSSWDSYRRRVKRGLRAADAIVAPSRSMLQALEQHYGPLSNARVIHNGRDLRHIREGEKEPIVLGAGRLWDRGKNLDLLASLAPRLGWPVLLAGEPSHPGESSADRLWPEGASGLGRVSSAEMEHWMRRASIYCHPARYEPFGLTVLEAALARCALVLSDIPTFRELWEGAAELVPSGDGGALEAALVRLIEDEPRRERLAAAAFERAGAFSRDRMSRDYHSLYQELVRSNSAGRRARSRGYESPRRESELRG
jgi:glycosyltransferase involved in cell wall biosynthesis